MTKTTIAGWTIPEVSSVGTLPIQTNHPRGFIVVDTVSGTARRGRRFSFELVGEDRFRKEDVVALVSVANRLAKTFGVTGVAAPKPLPTTVLVPGNGVVDIADLSEEALRFAIAMEQSKAVPSATLLEALKNELGGF